MRRELSQIARHPRRSEIETALARGAPIRKLSARYGLSVDCLYRHKRRLRREMPETFRALAAANWKVAPEELEQLRLQTADGWLMLMRAQHDKLVLAQDTCLESANYGVAAQLAAQVRGMLEMIGRAVGELATHSVNVQQNIFVSPDYWRARTAVVKALARHPEARADVLRALMAAEPARQLEAHGSAAA